MNILLLNGSPRKNGNTSALCDEFCAGATASGHHVTRFDLQSLHISGCLGCMKGGKHADHPCAQRDDMDQIYPVYQAADMVVLASPMYYWAVSAQLKTAIDRLFAVTEMDSQYRTPRKGCALLMAAEGDTEANWKPVLDYYHALLAHLEWTDHGTVLAGGVLQLGDIKGKPALAEARDLGARLGAHLGG